MKSWVIVSVGGKGGRVVRIFMGSFSAQLHGYITYITYITYIYYLRRHGSIVTYVFFI